MAHVYFIKKECEEMISNQKTIRLLLPQWQGGNNPNYAFGAELLAQIIPPNNHDKFFTVDVEQNFEQPLPLEHGIEGETSLLKQLEETHRILNNENPDRIITIGGDCAVSQAPFDYLKGKYQKKLGILWLDAHPDVASPKGSSRLHEMVLGNLLGHGSPRFAQLVKHPFQANEVMLAGLIYEELRISDQAVKDLNLAYITPKEIQSNSSKLIDWLRKNDIEYLAVHFDLDVLSPEDYRSIYPAEPYLKSFGAAIGQLKLSEVVSLLNDVSLYAEIVGLSITEHLPWDAFNLRKALSQISIFK